MPPIGSRADATGGMENYPRRCDNRDHKHDGRFHEFGHPRADMGNDPQVRMVPSTKPTPKTTTK